MAEGVLKNSKKKKPRTAEITAVKTAYLWKHYQVDMLYLAKKQFDIFRQSKIAKTPKHSVTRCWSTVPGKRWWDALSLNSNFVFFSVKETITMVNSFPPLSTELSHCLCKHMRTGFSSFRITGSYKSVPVSKKNKTCKRSLSVPEFSEDRVFLLSVPLQNFRV